jgi:Transposase and inactivated derivatives
MILPNRKLPRLQNYNYAKDGYYFVTICTHNKIKLFGDINHINLFGEIARDELLKIPSHYDAVKIDRHVIMPNHIHCIVVIEYDAEEERSRPFPTLSTIIGLYKAGVTKSIHSYSPDIQVWQRSFHDHIISLMIITSAYGVT